MKSQQLGKLVIGLASLVTLVVLFPISLLITGAPCGQPSDYANGTSQLSSVACQTYGSIHQIGSIAKSRYATFYVIIALVALLGVALWGNTLIPKAASGAQKPKLSTREGWPLYPTKIWGFFFLMIITLFSLMSSYK